MADFVIKSLRGGVNNTDPSNLIDTDQCVEMENVELHTSAMGSKRLGTAAINLSSATPFQDTNLDAVTFLFRHLPNDLQSDAELWALVQDLSAQDYGLMRKTSTWAEVFPLDGIKVESGYGLRINAVSFHEKMFIAYKTTIALDRLHVWDGTTVRRVGLAQPTAAPTVADEGSGSFTGKRYYRIRYTVQNGSGATLRRSEPSESVSITPSTTGAGITVTKPVTIGENETHWEVEASINDVDYYVIATVVVGTTTYNDEISAYTVGYAAGHLLSADIGDYTVPGAAEFLIVDDNRLILGGSLEDPTLSSQLSWTSVFTEVEMDGNDERIPLDSDNTVGLDGTDGGSLTGLSRPVRGTFYAFKDSAIHMASRSGIRSRAYDVECLTKERGALKGSVVNAFDQIGRPCVYFLDPVMGPCRLGAMGLQICSWDILTTWQEINLEAVRVSHGIYYPDNQQIRYWIATGDSLFPNQMLVVHLDLMRDGENGARRGWVTWSEGRSTTALCSCLFSDNIDDNTTRSRKLVPLVGLIESDGNRDMIQRCETGFLDSGNTYTARIISAPFFIGNLLNKIMVMSAVLLAKAASGVSLAIRVIADFGADTTKVKDVNSIDLTPTASEEQVIRTLDNESLGDIRSVQFEFGDLSADSGVWSLNHFAARIEDTDEA